MEKYNEECIYDLFIDSFQCMPIAAVAGGEYFCVHGGISPDIETISDIDKIDRYQEEPGEYGPFCDLLWADPATKEYAHKVNFMDNELRGCSYSFGKKPVNKFLKRN
jgi:serine/threonine-protein phosphatase 2B catalytic subunit